MRVVGNSSESYERVESFYSRQTSLEAGDEGNGASATSATGGRGPSNRSKENWHVEIADFEQQYFSTPAPVVIDNHGSAADLLAVLHGVLARPADGLDPAVHTTVSLGWVRAADHPGEDLSGLLRRADEAMYAAKQGRAGVRRAGLGRLFATWSGRRAGRRGSGAESGLGVAA